MSGTISLKWAAALLAGLLVAAVVLLTAVGGSEDASSVYSVDEQAAYDAATDWCERPDVQEQAGTTIESQLLLARNYAEVVPARPKGCSAPRGTAASTRCRRSRSRRGAHQAPACRSASDP